MEISAIRLNNVGKTFSNKRKQETRVLAGLSADFSVGEAIAIRGNNGTGKTTLLNILARLETPSEGELEFASSEPERIGFAQQDYTSSLLPWLTALQNVALPYRLRGTPSKIANSRASQTIESLGFGDLPLSNYPHQLSGGQKQRVAVARALAQQPSILLLDEPFANLDLKTTSLLRKSLIQAQESEKFMMIFVSHSLDESILLSDRIFYLAGKPSTFAAEIRVDLPRPRTTDDLFSEEFIKLRKKIIEFEEDSQ